MTRGKNATPTTQAKRGQIAMWMLTKFAMIFFIIALSMVLLSLSDAEKGGLCRTQAARIGEGVRGAITQVVNSPVEDERKVYSLESVLSTGKADFERYSLMFTHHAYGDGKHEIRVTLSSQSTDCVYERAAPFKAYEQDENNGFRLFLQGATYNPENHSILLEPSKPGDRSRYAVIVKCREKSYPYHQYLFLEDCRKDDPNECLSLNSGLPLACCGWEEPGGCDAASADAGDTT
ncbi:hypothetical protein COX86_02700 [Candidatus Micrarchaeota archaeon CG_4_10_14_0_2_um_filter_60_11]|nr:MAG: hypothetical protein AUJ16_01750 [Candidatus Micrarchaeota archaeon CG1_02_60_51]PIN95949.1 MAG: hypothetical protein COU39_03355 [Candidatus Micrarchaeota archaeon CG10_big_fil_rev_8_21_14_0_10_60_32]PIO02286.1 MAG: hypothetical protein COT58_00940 [Candidatus Micrarchaeota archaeon CG09_land_8_20_14_0_10_60_16]PIY91136.1 MAG: hypothetical protein COY71_04765 [Candidatus Micrarchaeota archaeon CG_4_10_14_0_8_um_filter_60_7]PIZ90874.1 MAG: hypothetical protein COX86_02700 [Candidatus Mi